MSMAERANKKDHATENWGKLVDDCEDPEDHPVPPLGTKPDTKPYLPRA